MDVLKIIKKYYKPGSKSYKSVVNHGRLVAKKAIKIAKNAKKNDPKLKIDMKFLEEAAMLHDIGVVRVHAPEIGCNGKHPYMTHGMMGKKILRKEGYPRHAEVCERHTGVGLTKADIIRQKLPLPKRDMLPRTIEEKIICIADMFYSKRPDMKNKEIPMKDIEKSLSRYGMYKVKKLRRMLKQLNYS